MSKRLLVVIAIGLFFSSPLLAQSRINAYEVPQVVAVEGKLYVPQKDLSVHIGILPLDAFYKALTLGISYTKQFESYLGWEIVNANAAFTQDTGLKKDLLDNFSVKPQGILEYPQYYITSNLIYTPLYSKSLVFNRNVVHSETSFVLGGGMVAFNSGESAPMFGGGAIFRIYKSHWISYKFDGRIYYTSAANKSSNFLLDINFGIAFEFGDEVKKDAI